jgi:predicted secreted protein
MANASRELLIKKATTRLLGIKSKSISVNKEPIDITSDEDNGFRLFLDVPGTKALDISFSGVTKDPLLRQAIMTGETIMLSDITIEYPKVGVQTTGDSISGDFVFNGFTENGGGSDGVIEFDGTLQSSGEWTYTAGLEV